MPKTQSIITVLASLAVVLACQTAPTSTTPSTTSEPTKTTDAALVPAKLTPDLIEKSEQILKQHGDAPVGTDFPLRMNGRRYLARIEVHEDDTKGKHKGVTLYEVK